MNSPSAPPLPFEEWYPYSPDHYNLDPPPPYSPQKQSQATPCDSRQEKVAPPSGSNQGAKSKKGQPVFQSNAPEPSSEAQEANKNGLTELMEAFTHVLSRSLKERDIAMEEVNKLKEKIRLREKLIEKDMSTVSTTRAVPTSKTRSVRSSKTSDIIGNSEGATGRAGTRSVSTGDTFIRSSSGMVKIRGSDAGLNGNSLVRVNNSRCALSASAGNNSVIVNNVNYVMSSSGGNSSVIVNNGNCVITASGGNNSVIVNNGDCVIKASGGNCSVIVNNGNCAISSSGGNSSVTVNNGNCVKFASGGNSSVFVNNGTSTMRNYPDTRRVTLRNISDTSEDETSEDEYDSE